MTGPQTSSAAEAPAIRQGEIAILIATRGRPELLAEVFKSLKANTVHKDKVVLWMYVDEDDDITRNAIDSGKLPDCGSAVHWHAEQSPDPWHRSKPSKRR